MTDLAKLVVRLEAETAKYMAGMEKAQQRLAKFEGSTTRALNKIRDQILGAFTVKKIIDWAQASIDAADQLGKLAQSTGITTEVISEMGYAAELSNISTEELAKTLQKLASSSVDATKAGSAQAKAFTALGVSVTDASGQMKETDQILLDIADRFSQLEDGAQKAALAEDIFGKQAQKLIPFLNQGRAGIEALRAEAKRLGVTLTADAAKSAEQFNDNITRLEASASGLGRQVAAKLLPYLIDLTETMLESATSGNTLQEAVDGIVVVFKTFATVALAANIVLQTIGKSIGTVAAALSTLDLQPTDLAGPGNLMMAIARNATHAGEAVGILKDGFTDIGAAVEKNVGRINELWKSADDRLREVDVTATKLGKTLGGLGGQDILQEVKITPQKIERTEMEKFFDELNEQTMTSSELAQREYNKQKEALETLYAAGIISAEQYNERVGEAFDKFLPQFEVTVDKIKEKTKKATDELTEFQKEAQRNTVDILAEGLETALDEGISKGADDALKAFGNMIEKMVLQAIAADIAGALFGKEGKGGLFDLGSLFGGFGGTRDVGGRGRKGMAYAIGKGAQPELFVPDTSGTFLPRDQWMGGGGIDKFTQIINVEGRPDPRTARQMEIEAARRQRSAQSRLG